MSPEIGPASQTRLVSVSESPRERRNGVPYLSIRIRFSDTFRSKLDAVCVPKLDSPSNLRPTHGHAQLHEVQRRHPPVAIAIALPIWSTRPLRTHRSCGALSVLSGRNLLWYRTASLPVPRGPSYLSRRIRISVRAGRGESHAAPLLVWWGEMRVGDKRNRWPARVTSESGGSAGLLALRTSCKERRAYGVTRLSPLNLVP